MKKKINLLVLMILIKRMLSSREFFIKIYNKIVNNKKKSKTMINVIRVYKLQ